MSQSDLNCHQSTAPIRPRTKDERMALLAAFAMALEAVDRRGLSFARAELRLMAECEEDLSE